MCVSIYFFLEVEMEKLKIGKIVGTHALKGELKIRSSSDFSEERFQKGKSVYVSYDKQMLTFEIVTVRVHKGNYLVTFKDHLDINLVEKYIGSFVYADKDEELLEEGEYYIEDIIGCEVVSDDGKALGKVTDVLDNGRHDNLVVNGNYGKVVIPYVDAFIVAENMEQKQLIVKLIPGMLHED